MFLCNTRFSSPQHSLDNTTWTLESKEQGSCKRVTKLFENDWKCPIMLVETGLRFAFRVTCPFHEGRVWLPSFCLYSLIPPSCWLWSLSLLPGSSHSSPDLQKRLSDLCLPAYSVVCAGLVKWIGEKEWLEGHQSQPKIRVWGRASGIGRRGKMVRTTMSTPRCWQRVVRLAYPISWDCTLKPFPLNGCPQVFPVLFCSAAIRVWKISSVWSSAAS